MSEAPDNSGFLVFNSCFCCIATIDTNFGNFIGCKGENECLCVKQELCCAANTPAMPIVAGVAEGFICKIGLPCCSYGCKVPAIILKSHGQCFCFNGNAALPPDADTPAVCAVYGLQCFPKQGCCLKLGDSLAAKA